jgi:hypothetical protein
MALIGHVENSMPSRLVMASMVVLTLFALCGCAGAYVAGDVGPDHHNLQDSGYPSK